jgi:RimJ/RimL family protein N-acetyltransferase
MAPLPLPAPPLDDGVVRLRPPTDADVPAIATACHDPEVGRWTSIPFPYSERDAREFVTRVEPARRAGEELGFVIADAGNGTLLGGCGLHPVDREHGRAEAGYYVAAAARRRGVGTRALRLLSRWALGDLGLERVEVLVHPENEPSQRLAVAAGFTREGVLRSYRERKGVREDYVLFSLVSADLTG